MKISVDSLRNLVILYGMSWKPVPSAPLYEASRGGLVRRVGKQHALKPWVNKSGHLYISLSPYGKFQVHHVILETFGPPRPAGYECRHLDGNKNNNHIRNLKWGTRAQNIQDFRRHNGRHWRAKLSLSTARQIKKSLTGEYGEQRRIAKKFGVSEYIVSAIKRGRTYA